VQIFGKKIAFTAAKTPKKHFDVHVAIIKLPQKAKLLKSRCGCNAAFQNMYNDKLH